MFTVLLIGDSIRMHYQKFVAENLRHKARIVGPTENCESSRHIKTRLQSWLDLCAPDLIHMNCGLHDIRQNPGESSNQVSLVEYAENLECIFQELVLTQAKVIWATTTPINEKLHNQIKLSRRYEADLQSYNQTALEVARNWELEINDLHACAQQHGVQNFLKEDGVHYTSTGYQSLGLAVSQKLQKVIGN